MLHSGKHSTFLVAAFLLFDDGAGQIKYLRVPDTLLDAVKDEQSRAREARGSHVGSRGTSEARSCAVSTHMRDRTRVSFERQVDCVWCSCVCAHLIASSRRTTRAIAREGSRQGGVAVARHWPCVRSSSANRSIL